jgi:tetratricopeptide (TPR) repeat protein
MRAVLDATWGMLAKDERQAFARLSVFRGGFTREAAEAVAGAGLRTLISLVSKSLLQCDQSGRYQIHELLRQYAEEQLEGSEETLDLHAAYYAQFLAGRETDLLKGYLDESLREIDNIRAAWRRLTAHAHLAEIHKCLYSLHSLYQGPGLFQEGEAVFAAAVDALQPGPGEDLDDERAAAWGLALVMQGYFAAWFGHVDRAVERTEQGLSILHRLGDRRELAVANILAVGARAWTDTSRARQLLEESLVISQRLQLVSDQAQGRGGLAFIAMVEGAYREAEQHAQEALAVWRRTDHRYNAAIELAMLGHAARGLGEYERARECYEEGLTLFREAHQSWGVGRMYSHLGDVAMAVGDYDQARECHRNALARYQDEGFYWVELSAIIGGSWGVPVSLQRLGDVALAVGDRQGARQHYGQSVQMAIDHPYIELQLYVPLGPARLLAQEGRTEQAVQLAALARHHPAGVEETRDKAGELLDKLRSEMSPEIYAAAEARGRARDLEATMWELLEELGS